ncbi:MAG TPA: RHS repeat-associated core domain-containing protein, partial [Acidimicrobiales bacterium]|nr:RHS repeat-associated core domain-containing protein [Acidimicrobiales bacterium]
MSIRLRTTVAPLTQVLRAHLRVGDDIDLHWSSRRATGRRTDVETSVALVPDPAPDGLTEVDIVVEVAGQRHETTRAAEPGSTHTHRWDGCDGEGRPVRGVVPVTTRVGWRQRQGRRTVTRWWDHHDVVGVWDGRDMGLGGWTVGGCHALDPAARVVHLGDGGRRDVRVLTPSEAGRVGSRWGRLADDELAVADGRDLLVFDVAGRHRRTLDGVTGSVRMQVEHDDHGRVAAWTRRGTDRSLVRRGDDRWSILGADGMRLDLGFDPAGRLVWAAVPGLEPVTIEYDDGDLVTSTTDARGLRSTFTHDADGRLVTLARATGERQDLVRHGDGRSLRVVTTTAGGRERSVAERRLPAGGHRTERRCCGLTSPRIDVWSGGEHEVLHPDGTRALRTVAADGPDRRELTTVTTPAGRSLVSVREVVHRAGGIEERLTLAGRTMVRRYDPATRTIVEVSRAGRTGSISRDAATRTMRTTRPGSPVIEITADAEGRPVRVRRGDQTLEFERDSWGRVVAVTDEARRRAFAHDELGRVIGQEVAGGWLRFGLDAAGDVVRVEPPGRPATELRRTPDGLLAEVRYPEVDGHADVEHLEYDADRQLVAHGWAGGPTVRVVRDAAGRVERLVGPEGATTFEWDGAGRLVRATSPSGHAVRYEHDGALVVAEQLEGPVAGRVERHLDDARRLQRLVVHGVPIDHEHDADGLVTRVGPVRITRDDATGLATTMVSGAVVTHLQHDGHGRLTRSVTMVGERVLLDEVLTHDPTGRVVGVVERCGDQLRHIEVRRDDGDRLAAVIVDGATALRVERGANGDALRIERDGRVDEADTDDADRLRRLGERRYGYSPAGEVTSVDGPDGTTRLAYDGHGRLTEVALPDGHAVTHAYDALGRRVATEVDDRRVLGLLWHRGDPVAQLDAGGAVTARFVHLPGGGAPTAMITADRALRLVADVTGSVRLVVDVATGEVVQRCEYDPLGRRTVDTAPGFQPFGFAGGLHDATTGLVRFGVRELDPVTGRFTSRDPLRFAGGQTNLYLYADGNPFDWRDPTGTKVQVCSRPVPGLGSRPFSVDHVYLKTDTHAKGMDRDTSARNPFRTKWVDEPYPNHPETECDEIENVDEECVNQQLESDHSLGVYGFGVEGGKLDPNVCWDAVWDALDACSDGDWEVKEDGDDESAHGPIAETARALDRFRKWQREVIGSAW